MEDKVLACPFCGSIGVGGYVADHEDGCYLELLTKCLRGEYTPNEVMLKAYNTRTPSEDKL